MAALQGYVDHFETTAAKFAVTRNVSLMKSAFEDIQRSVQDIIQSEELSEDEEEAALQELSDEEVEVQIHQIPLSKLEQESDERVDSELLLQLDWLISA